MLAQLPLPPLPFEAPLLFAPGYQEFQVLGAGPGYHPRQLVLPFPVPFPFPLLLPLSPFSFLFRQFRARCGPPQSKQGPGVFPPLPFDLPLLVAFPSFPPADASPLSPSALLSSILGLFADGTAVQIHPHSLSKE